MEQFRNLTKPMPWEGIIKTRYNWLKNISSGTDLLLNYYRKAMEEALEQGLPLTWDKSPNLETYASDLVEKSELYLEKARASHTYEQAVNTILPELASCSFQNEAFSAHLNKIQELTSAILDKYPAADTDAWLSFLNQRIGEALFKRLLTAVQLWKQTLAQPITRYTGKQILLMTKGKGPIRFLEKR